MKKIETLHPTGDLRAKNLSENDAESGKSRISFSVNL